ncbi:MAG: hypothetical protein ACRC2T_14805 [Thermoguttaceae bacterium]
METKTVTRLLVEKKAVLFKKKKPLTSPGVLGILRPFPGEF